MSERQTETEWNAELTWDVMSIKVFMDKLLPCVVFRYSSKLPVNNIGFIKSLPVFLYIHFLYQ